MRAILVVMDRVSDVEDRHHFRRKQRAIVVNGVIGPWELIKVGGKPTLTLNGMTVGVEYPSAWRPWAAAAA